MKKMKAQLISHELVKTFGVDGAIKLAQASIEDAPRHARNFWREVKVDIEARKARV